MFNDHHGCSSYHSFSDKMLIIDPNLKIRMANFSMKMFCAMANSKQSKSFHGK